MKIIIVLISVSLSIAVGFLFLFLWSVKSGQFDDVYTPSVRMLFDDKIKSNDSDGRNDQTNQGYISADVEEPGPGQS
jgi:cbb3-type cytochrome oxidase maturation protein